MSDAHEASGVNQDHRVRYAMGSSMKRQQTDRERWAARFNQAPRQNFCYITIAHYLNKYPQHGQEQQLQRIAALPNRLCVNCGQFNVWKLIMTQMPENDMCFTCITGETDAREDYELVP